MFPLDPRPYPRLTAEQQEAVCREVTLYVAIMDRYRRARHATVAPKEEQLAWFPAERLNV